MNTDVVKSVAKKKSMRVATVLAGAAAFAIPFAQPARAASSHATVPPNSPYKIWVTPGFNVSRQQVCGYKLTGSNSGTWECTAIQHNNGYPTAPGYDYMGSSWRKGHINVWMWGPGGRGLVSCNTNHVSTFSGWFGRTHQSLDLAHSNGFGIPASLDGPATGYQGC